MFESIKHVHSSAGSMTIAIFADGDVGGSVSFHTSENRTAVHSELGPICAVRCCGFSNWLSPFSDQYKARITESVTDYSHLTL